MPKRPPKHPVDVLLRALNDNHKPADIVPIAPAIAARDAAEEITAEQVETMPIKEVRKRLARAGYSLTQVEADGRNLEVKFGTRPIKTLDS